MWNSKKGKNIPKCQDGKECRYALGYQDVPNKYGNLKFRALYTLVSFFILGANVIEGNGFFTSLLMFSAPLLYDNIKFDPVEISRSIVKNISIIVLILQGLVGFLGLCGVFQCVNTGEMMVKVNDTYLVMAGFSIPLKYIWGSISIDIVLVIIDLVLARPKFSRSVVNESLTA